LLGRDSNWIPQKNEFRTTLHVLISVFVTLASNGAESTINYCYYFPFIVISIASTSRPIANTAAVAGTAQYLHCYL
jgi:hypothetical protein